LAQTSNEVCTKCVNTAGIAREAQLGVWGSTDRPSSSGPEALDKVAVALATPPNPAPTGSILFWYLHPWQSPIAGLFGLIGAALVLVAAKHQANAQIHSVTLQIEKEKKSSLKIPSTKTWRPSMIPIRLKQRRILESHDDSRCQRFFIGN